MNLIQTDLKALCKKVRELALEAGERVMSIYNGEFKISEKEDQSPVTSADLESNRLITHGLNMIAPNIPILSEESARVPFSVRSHWQTYWLVDPLDGTKEFIKRNGEFSINIALIQGNRPVMGVVYAPVRNMVYHAVAGEGAFTSDHEKTGHSIRVRPAPDRLTVVGSRSHPSSEFKAYLARLGDYELVRMGSSLKFCLIAEGGADLYPRFGPTSEWDTAAAQCVLEAAGGHVTDLHMNPLQYNTKASLENPGFFAFGASGRDWSAYLDAES